MLSLSLGEPCTSFLPMYELAGGPDVYSFGILFFNLSFKLGCWSRVLKTSQGYTAENLLFLGLKRGMGF